MPFASDTAQNAALDALWGVGRAASMPATFEVGLLTANPQLGGVELSGGGYARVTRSNNATFWPAAAGGVKTSVMVSLPAATGIWAAAGTWWGIWVSGALFDFGRLSDAITAAGPGPVAAFSLSVYFDGLAA